MLPSCVQQEKKVVDGESTMYLWHDIHANVHVYRIEIYSPPNIAGIFPGAPTTEPTVKDAKIYDLAASAEPKLVPSHYLSSNL